MLQAAIKSLHRWPESIATLSVSILCWRHAMTRLDCGVVNSVPHLLHPLKPTSVQGSSGLSKTRLMYRSWMVLSPETLDSDEYCLARCTNEPFQFYRIMPESWCFVSVSIYAFLRAALLLPSFWRWNNLQLFFATSGMNLEVFVKFYASGRRWWAMVAPFS